MQWTEDIWKEESPEVTLIRATYSAYHLSEWTNNRVAALCRLSKRTIYEICAIAGITQKSRVKHLWEQSAKTGKGWPQEIALHFAKLECFIYEEVFHEKQVPSPYDCLMARMLDKIEEQNNEQQKTA